MKSTQLSKIQSKQNVATSKVLNNASFSNVKNSINVDSINYNVTKISLQDVVNYSLKFYSPLFNQFGSDFKKECKTQFALCILNCGLSPLHFCDSNGNIVAKRAMQCVKKSANNDLATLLCNVWQKLKEIEQSYNSVNEVSE